MTTSRDENRQHEVAECSLGTQVNTHLLHAGTSHTGEDGSSYIHRENAV